MQDRPESMRCAGCDIENGCPEYCWCTPTAARPVATDLIERVRQQLLDTAQHYETADNIDELVERLLPALVPAPAPSAQRLMEAPAELRGLDTATRVRFYEHDFYVLSNFSAFTLVWKNMRFDTSEAAYHWEKFEPHYTALRDAIRQAPSAHEAFKLAELNVHCRRPDWDEVKVGVMLDILRAKVGQHGYVRRKLLETGERELVEDSWRDAFWGWGPNRNGKNMLGRLWMQVRDELRAHGITE